MTNRHEEIFAVLSEIHTEFLQIQSYLPKKQQFMPFAIIDLRDRLEILTTEIHSTNLNNNNFFKTYVPKLKSLLDNALTSHKQ